MRIAIVGCGYVADHYLETLPNHPRLALQGVADLNLDRADAVAKHYGTRVYPSTQDLLADPEVELVVNLTDPDSHYEVTRASLLAGKHVYSEKPLSVDLSEARELLELAEKQGLLLSGAPCSVLGETAQTLWKAVRDGAVGRRAAGLCRDRRQSGLSDAPGGMDEPHRRTMALPERVRGRLHHGACRILSDVAGGHVRTRRIGDGLFRVRGAGQDAGAARSTGYAGFLRGLHPVQVGSCCASDLQHRGALRSPVQDHRRQGNAAHRRMLAVRSPGLSGALLPAHPEREKIPIGQSPALSCSRFSVSAARGRSSWAGDDRRPRPVFAKSPPGNDP